MLLLIKYYKALFSKRWWYSGGKFSLEEVEKWLPFSEHCCHGRLLMLQNSCGGLACRQACHSSCQQADSDCSVSLFVLQSAKAWLVIRQCSTCSFPVSSSIWFFSEGSKSSASHEPYALLKEQMKLVSIRVAVFQWSSREREKCCCSKITFPILASNYGSWKTGFSF